MAISVLYDIVREFSPYARVNKVPILLCKQTYNLWQKPVFTLAVF